MEKLEDLETEYCSLGWQHVLGSSGTIKTVSKVLISNGFRDGLITEKRLKNIIQACLKFNSLKEIQLKGLIEERADVLVPGLAILLALFHTFKIESMRYSDGALREGLMYGLEKYFQVDDIRQRTAQALAIQFNIDKAQAHRVEHTALSLFDQVKMWKNRHQVVELRELIKWASLLHEIGIVINHNNVNKHSAYIISNATLAGFDDEQQALLATLIRFHLKGFKKSDLRSTSRYQYRDILTLLRLFRLAVLFNRSRQASVMPKTLKLHINQNDWALQFEADYLVQNPLVQADLLDEQKQLAMIDLQLSME